jgi:hypothetical protein
MHPHQHRVTLARVTPARTAPTTDTYRSAVYGSVLVTALVAALRDEISIRDLTLTVAATIAVFWIAHLWSSVVAERVEHGDRFSFSTLRELVREELPMIEVAVAPVAALAFGWAGGYSRDTAVDLALAFGVLQLLGWGFRVGRRIYGGRWMAYVTGLLDGALGFAIVALEVAVH